MTYSPCDYQDDVNRALGISLDTDDCEEQAEAAIAEVIRLQAIEKAHKAAPATTMERMLYLVAPTNEQCDGDADGTVSRDLFVWATDASEAIQLWRRHYELDDDPGSSDDKLGTTEEVRVYECPIMPVAAGSTVVCWGEIHVYGATITERVQL